MDTFVNVALWTAQGFLALFFLGAGAPKVLGRGLDRWTGFSGLPRSQVVVTGLAEVLAAAGLVLPLATTTLPWLTPVAAVGIALVSLMAAGFHVRLNEHLNVIETSLLAGVAAAVAVGRWGQLTAASFDLKAWMPAVAVAVLVPAAIAVVIALFKAQQDQAPSADHPTPAGLATGTR